MKGGQCQSQSLYIPLAQKTVSKMCYIHFGVHFKKQRDNNTGHITTERKRLHLEANGF